MTLTRTAALAVVLLLSASAAADSAKDLIFQARHAEAVQGDLDKAIQLYEKALKDRGLGPRLQAEVHLHLGMCFKEKGEHSKALPHLADHIYAPAEVLPGIRQQARTTERELRDLVQKPETDKPPRQQPDPVAIQRQRLNQRFRDTLAEARALRDESRLVRALERVRFALYLIPDNPEALALAAELESSLDDTAAFVRDALGWLKAYTNASTKVVAAKAAVLLKQGRQLTYKKRFTQAEQRYREAVQVIDECEFADESYELAELRKKIEETWRTLRRVHLKAADADPRIEKRPRRATLRADFLDDLQRMLDAVSTGGREYRIFPVAPKAEKGGKQLFRKPPRFLLSRDQASAWSPALFAKHLVRLRVSPASWDEPGNRLDAAVSMLFVRNEPKVLDAVQAEVARIEKPAADNLAVRFLLASVPRAALSTMHVHFGPYKVAPGKAAPILYQEIELPPGRNLDWFRTYLTELGGEDETRIDLFRAELRNGMPQTLFVNESIRKASGYDQPGAIARGLARRASDRNFGLMLDVYPLRDERGRVATGLKISSRIPERPTRIQEGAREKRALYPRYVEQRGELFVDLKPGTLLLVADLVDPFSAARGMRDPERSFLLAWENVSPGGAPAAAPAGSVEAERDDVEIPLGDLLQKVHDDPGPSRTQDRGFAARDPLTVVKERAAFLERILREETAGEMRIDLEGSSVTVPQALRDRAVQVVARLEEEARRSYAVYVHVRAVRTSVFERWHRREGFALESFGKAALVRTSASSGEFLFRNLASENGDVYAPAEEMAGFAALGLQARHAISARVRSFPAPTTVEELAKARTRLATEGIRITVRPFTWNKRLRAEIRIETAAVDDATETGGPNPSYEIRTIGTEASGLVDMGKAGEPATAVIAHIPHPTAAGEGGLTEIVIAVTVRPSE